MIRCASFVMLTVALCGSIATPQVTVKKKRIERTSAASGQEMYKHYCAVCHGTDGKGDGPAAPALKKQPTDLTSLAAKNNGQFPILRVQNSIEKGVVSAHGTSDMPVWGPLFKDIGGTAKTPQGEIQQRVHNLADYIKSLQK